MESSDDAAPSEPAESKPAEEQEPAQVVPLAGPALATLEPPQAREPAPVYALPATAPYHPPPSYPPPPHVLGAPADGRAVAAMLAAIAGIVLGLPVGIPGLALGPLAYFLGRSALSRIDASNGAIGGRGLATAAWVMGVIATAIGALVSLGWLVYILLTISGFPPSQ
ncbi:MAG TPA: hypothetical protein VEW68_09970 [Patescibacteria group bacterium]|nr:hypothetical protein [Patescibacteria group bacterium]